MKLFWTSLVTATLFIIKIWIYKHLEISDWLILFYPSSRIHIVESKVWIPNFHIYCLFNNMENHTRLNSDVNIAYTTHRKKDKVKFSVSHNSSQLFLHIDKKKTKTTQQKLINKIYEIPKSLLMIVSLLPSNMPFLQESSGLLRSP